MEISHIINVYDSDDPDAVLAQQITLDSLLKARKNLKHPIDVKILACKHVSDCVTVPSGVEFIEGLTRYAHDAHPGLPDTKLLPVLRDILSRGLTAYDSDFYIYSNSDIGAYPNLYNKIFNLIEEGYDAACINRTTLPKSINGEPVTTSNYQSLLNKSPLIPHGGADFFLFANYGKFCLHKLGSIFIGYPPIGAVMLEWLNEVSQNFVWLKEIGNTFHLGNDMPWREKCQYNDVNHAEGLKLYPKFETVWKRF
jgi:hypothetical protein